MQNPFTKWFSFLQPATESVIGIDAGSSYLKVVQLRRKGGKAILETYGSLALGPYGDLEVGRAVRLSQDKLIEALKDLLREAHVTTTRAGLALPFASSLVIPIELPLLPEKELTQAVPIEARKFVPVPMGEVSLDWWILPEEPGSAAPAQRTRILLAAVHKDIETRFQSVAMATALTHPLYEIEVFSALRAMVGDDLSPKALLDCGAGETKLYLIDRGVLVLSHAINHGAQDLTLALSRSRTLSVEAAEEQKRAEGLTPDTAPSFQGILNLIFSEIGSALRAFEKKRGHGIGEIALIGGGANLPGLTSFAEQALGMKVMRANPFSRVEAPAFLDQTLSLAGPEFAVALGVAFKVLQESSG